MIQLYDLKFEPFISADKIQSALADMAGRIAADFSGEIPVFIGVMNGAFMVVSDLMKHYSHPCEVSFVKLSSYKGTESTQNVKQLIGLEDELVGRTVIVVEDIVDTGHTVEKLKTLFEGMNVKQLKFAALFFKPEAYKKDIEIDYIGMEIPNKFIVGYGLDYNGLGRNLPEVYQVKQK